MRSSRNKTIDIDEISGAEYLSRCIRWDREDVPDDVTDSLITGDSFEVMKRLPRGIADLVIVDPPYNLDKDFNGRGFKRSSDEDYAGYTGEWISLVLPLLKRTGSLYVCCDWRSGSVIYEVLKKHLKVRNRITWQREKGRGAKSNWKNSMEDIYFATVSDEYTFNLDAVKQRRKVVAPYRKDGKPKDWEETEDGRFRNTHPSNFWDDISVPYWSMKENTAHPTQKPEKLMAKLILASSDPGDLVFDPFAGSGSSLVAAKKLGRHYAGIEQNDKYCIWAEKRLEMADSDSTIQGYADGVFWERNSAPVRR